MACSGSAPEPGPASPAPQAAPSLPEPAPTPPPGPPTAVAPTDSGAQVTRLLDHLDDSMVATFPADSPEPVDTLALPSWTHDTEADLWTHPTPTRFDHKQYRDTPPGTDLLDDTGQPIAFEGSLATGGKCVRAPSCWEIRADTLYFRGASPTGTTLRHTPSLHDQKRRSPSHSGLSHREFVDWSATLDGITREALLVPTDSAVTLRLTVPEGAHLRFGFGAPSARIHRPAHSPTGSVAVNDKVVWTATTTSDTPWTDHTVDLADYAGQTVKLRFQAAPDNAENTARAAAFAEPTIVPRLDGPKGPNRVVVVGIDTLRLDHLGLHGGPPDLTPGLDARGQAAILFDNAYTPAPRTRPSFRSALTGRWPLDAIGAPPLTRRFADAGFTTAGIVANVHLQPHLGFADGAGLWDYHDSDDAGPRVDRAIAWLDAHAREDSFLFLHLMDPHIFYLAPEPFQDAFTTGLPRAQMPDRYNRWTIDDAMQEGRLKPPHKDFIQARYKGEVRYLDHELSRLLAHIDTLPGDTLVVLHSDHGEEFWDHGGFEHNHSLYPELMRTMLWVIPPRGWANGPVRVEAPVSLIDIVPTLIELYDLPISAEHPVDGTSLAAWLDPTRTTDQAAQSALLHDRPLQLGHLMFNREQWGVVSGDWAYTLETMTGTEAAFHLPTDPTWQQNSLSDAPLDTLRAALQTATGWPVGPGWRIQLKGPKTPFSLVFDNPVHAAGVLDPEAGRTRRANLEWGEVPPKLPADVATVTLSADQRTVHVVPGPHPHGSLYILGPAAGDSVEVRSPKSPTYRISPGSRMLGKAAARIAAGILIVPRSGEGAHLAELGDPRLVEALRAMGYIE